ncbi:TerD family protein [Streptomyces sp. NPDC015139]|uniref:TerD family protein n=1 Tax=Streptomyces sp. NPDC015139 TaxID=3364942 RepID=UPI0036FE41CA
MRLVDQADDREITRYDLAENAPGARAVVFGEVLRTDTGWKFRGHGQSDRDRRLTSSPHRALRWGVRLV